MPKTKKKKEKRIKVYTSSHEDRFDRLTVNLKHKDIKKECVLRGMSFELVVKGSTPDLMNWLFKNMDNGQDPKKLAEYDVYIENLLLAQGYKTGDAVLSPSLRLGFTKEIEKLDKIQDPKKTNSVPKVDKKPKAEIDEKTGVRKGTKKALTYELTNSGKTIAEIIKLVKASFPDSEEKSIKIWHKRCLKSINNG